MQKKNELQSNIAEHELINLMPDVPFKIYLSDQHPKSIKDSYIVPHYHDDIEIIYILEGNINVFDGTLLNELHSGNVYLVNSNSIHSTSSSSQHTKNYILQISYDFLINFIPDFPKYKFVINNDNPKIENLKKDISSINTILNAKNDKDAYLLCLSYLFDLIYLLMNNFSFQISSQSAKRETKYHRRISKVIGYIENNYSNQITLSEVSNYVHLSTTYFSHFFKNQMGVNFYNYLTNIRMKHVENELRHTNKEILQIMYNCGFTTYHQFRKEFYQRYQMTPSKFRKQLFNSKNNPNR
ncbi:helix-turn-helix domain-containing protein [Companilactobacillus formosensis]|uniref:helix-turn-helix domain-containing protein n=1 Tax=Companilactobacillus formosensis TaxID=1617889 RepID=UPI000E64BE16|nr:AraC family transcriptional regulator [Companilactobacillus formosensis]